MSAGTLLEVAKPIFLSPPALDSEKKRWVRLRYSPAGGQPQPIQELPHIQATSLRGKDQRHEDWGIYGSKEATLEKFSQGGFFQRQIGQASFSAISTCAWYGEHACKLQLLVNCRRLENNASFSDSRFSYWNTSKFMSWHRDYLVDSACCLRSMNSEGVRFGDTHP